MMDISQVNIKKDELIKLLKRVNRKVLVRPLNKKEFSSFTHGFRKPENVNDTVLANFYYSEVFIKHNSYMCDYFNNITKEICKKFERDLIDITDNYKSIIEEENLLEFKNIISKLEKIQYDIELLPILFKLIDIDLSKTSLFVISYFAEYKADISKAIEQTKLDIEHSVRSTVEEEYNVKFSKSEKSFQEQIEQKEQSYNTEKSELLKKVEHLKNEKADLHGEYGDKFKTQHEKNMELENSLQELSKKNSVLENQLMDKTSESDKLAEKILDLEKKCKEYEGLVRLKTIDKTMLESIIRETEFNNQLLKKRFIEYIDNLPVEEGDRNTDILREWNKWVKDENDKINSILGKILENENTLSEDMILLDELSYVLQFRYLLLKLIMSLGYKYLASECYKEIFG